MEMGGAPLDFGSVETPFLATRQCISPALALALALTAGQNKRKSRSKSKSRN
jgi:hypothetical protein